MVFFNYATMQMAAKIVYYGPGLCGKTTNLHHIYSKTSPQSRGEMVSLETETDRTLFFDLLPIDVGVIGGFKTRLQLYTVPGQVFYNTTRKLVLKGVDGIVFVCDSQKAMIDANVESFKNLRENLAEIGLSVDEIPLVFQLNKRDLPNVAEPEIIARAIDPEKKYDYVEAVASKGDGVFETLKTISKQTLRTLRRRMTGEEPAKPIATNRPSAQFRVTRDESGGVRAATPAQAAPPQPAAAPPKKVSTAPIPAVTPPAPAPTPPPQPAPKPTPPPISASTLFATPKPEPPRPVQTVEQVAPPPPVVEEAPFAESTLARSAANVDAHIIADAPVLEIEVPDAPLATQYVPPPQIAKPAPAAEPEITFGETEKAAKAKPQVKTVKVKSVDVMAELEALRKRATQSNTPKPAAKKEEPIPAEVVAPPPRTRDVHRNLSLQLAPDVLPRAKSVRVTVSFEDADTGVLQKQDQFVDLGDTSDIQSLSLNLKIDLA